MRWDEIDSQICSVARALSVVGDRWTLLIIRDAFLGTHRFDDFQKQLGISRHRLSDRLQKLVTDGVLEKVAYQDNPPRFDYNLTAKGLALQPVLMMLAQWGNEWQNDGNGDPIQFRHDPCGAIVPADVTCAACGEKMMPGDVTPVPGPGLRAAIERESAKGEDGSDYPLPPALRQATEGLN